MIWLRHPQVQPPPLVRIAGSCWLGGRERAKEHHAERTRGGGEERAQTWEVLSRVLAVDAHDHVAVLVERRVHVLKAQAHVVVPPADERVRRGLVHDVVRRHIEPATLASRLRHRLRSPEMVTWSSGVGR